jgi:NDP-sugar pyrophosphorylase family protein
MPSPTQAQIEQLKTQGCSATDWSKLSIDAGADLTRIRNAHFHGVVVVGVNRGHATVDGVELPCGIFDATVADCTIGANVRIARVGSVVARCQIDDGAVIQDVASLTTDANCTFGAGMEIEAVNEGGGRTVRLVPGLTAQFAYLQAFRLHSEELRRALGRLVDAEVAAARSDRGLVGANARVLHCGLIRNVAIGPHAMVRGAALLEDGTILSCSEHPTVVGEAVQARHFVIAEGASVTGGALLEKVFVGQACRVGKQFSAEHALFFANCELFHGEAVSVFGGPYTVTHHKGTLLIAAGFSFYNAGSGTNQSNHMYKLGPVHQGVFERGTKTGSFAYVLHETHIGAFSVVIGKHYANINTPDLPFTYIHEVNGQSEMIPGMNLASVGTVRDGEKWPKRDGRKGKVRRDLISFGVFTPFTVEKMRAGRSLLRRLHETTPKEKLSVQYGGVAIKRLLLRKGAKYYAHGVTRYLNGRVLDRIERAGAKTWREVQHALRHVSALRQPLAWTDVGGLLMPVERLQALEQEIVSGALASLDAVQRRFAEIAALSDADEWEYVCAAFAEDQGCAPEALTREQAETILAAHDEAAAALHAMVLDDSRKEFGAFARIGFGLGMSEEDRMADFTAVRGSADTNAVVQKLVSEQAAMTERSGRLSALLATF